MNGAPRDCLKDNLLEGFFAEIGMGKGNYKTLEAINTLTPVRQYFTKIQ